MYFMILNNRYQKNINISLYLHNILINIYNMFLYLCSNLLSLFLYIKYFVYLQIFLLSLLVNKLWISVTGDTNPNILHLLYLSINLNGSAVIKLVQWYIPRLDETNDKETSLQKLLKNYYENCPVHSMTWTNKIFLEEYREKFEDVFNIDPTFDIKSGSIAQVYKCYYNNSYSSISDNSTVIVKVIHPETKWQLFWIKYIFLFWIYITRRIKFLKRYSLPINFDKFIENFTSQFDMNNEYNNLLYYYNYYSDNEWYVIPKPIFRSKNILIMSYEEGEAFEDLKVNEYIMCKIFVLFNLFVRNNNFYLDLIHIDLHSGNWKVRQYRNFYQIIIYDFGYCCKNCFKDDIIELIYNIDTNNMLEILKLSYKYKIKCNVNIDKFANDGLEYINNSIIDKKNEWINNNNYNVKLMILYLNTNNYIVNYNLLELFIISNIISKNVDKYIISKNTTKYNIIYLYNSICKEFNIFLEQIEVNYSYYLKDNNSLNYFDNFYLKQFNNNNNSDSNSNSVELLI